MNITIYIDIDGKVTITDLPIDLCGVIQNLNKSFFCSVDKSTSGLLEKQHNIIKNKVNYNEFKKI